MRKARVARDAQANDAGDPRDWALMLLFADAQRALASPLRRLMQAPGTFSPVGLIDKAHVDALGRRAHGLVLVFREHNTSLRDHSVGDCRLTFGGGMKGARIDAGQQELYPAIALHRHRGLDE